MRWPAWNPVMTKVLIVPGKGGSGAAHWQTWLEARLPDSLRVDQAEWESPDVATWARRIHDVASRRQHPPFVIAHSFGCLATIHAALHLGTRFRGSFLVAPADPARFAIDEASLLRPLPHEARVFASTNDPWLDTPRCSLLAAAWGADLQVLGALGHINVDSGFGPWPEMLGWAEAALVAVNAP